MATLDPATDYALTFYFPTKAAATTTVTMRSPDFGDTENLRKRQVYEETAGDALIAYSRGPSVYELEFTLTAIVRSQRDAFVAFFDDDADGMKNTFEIRRPDYHDLDSDGIPNQGTLYTGCQFLSDEMPWAETHRDGRGYSTQIKIRATGKTSTP